MEVLQTSALPLGDGAASGWNPQIRLSTGNKKTRNRGLGPVRRNEDVGAGNGIRTRDFDLGKVALYH
jgi:hypothetical protein